MNDKELTALESLLFHSAINIILRRSHSERFPLWNADDVFPTCAPKSPTLNGDFVKVNIVHSTGFTRVLGNPQMYVFYIYNVYIYIS